MTEEERLNSGSIEQEFYDPEVGPAEEGYPASRRRRRNKNKKGKKVALTILVLGGLVAGSIFGTKAYYSSKETRRVDNLLSQYTVEDYCVVPTHVTSDRAYDITFADGQKLVDRLNKNNIGYINIGGQFYTPNGNNIAIINYDVTYFVETNSITFTNEGQTVYAAPSGYQLYGKRAYKYITERKTVIVPEGSDYSQISFANATSWEMVGEPQIVSTLPYSVITNSTLICDVPDNAVLNENNECDASLQLAPKMR